MDVILGEFRLGHTEPILELCLNCQFMFGNTKLRLSLTNENKCIECNGTDLDGA